MADGGFLSSDRNVLENCVLRQLESEEEKARHRLAGDELLVDVHNAVKGEPDPVRESEFCQKMFDSTDADGGGAIEAEELKQCLILMKVRPSLLDPWSCLTAVLQLNPLSPSAILHVRML